MPNVRSSLGRGPHQRGRTTCLLSHPPPEPCQPPLLSVKILIFVTPLRGGIGSSLAPPGAIVRVQSPIKWSPVCASFPHISPLSCPMMTSSLVHTYGFQINGVWSIPLVSPRCVGPNVVACDTMHARWSSLIYPRDGRPSWVGLHSCNTSSRNHVKACHTWESLLATCYEGVPSNAPYLAEFPITIIVYYV